MNISNLPKGTKLIWDAQHNRSKTGDPIILPCTVGEKQKTFKWAKIHFTSNRHWMGPDEEYLREPTEEELKTLTWPEVEQNDNNPDELEKGINKMR